MQKRTIVLVLCLFVFAGLLQANVVQCFPQSTANWTGTTTTSARVDDSRIREIGGNSQVGWFIFDVSAVPAGVTINSITFNAYADSTNYPYWSLTPLTCDPLTATPDVLHADIIAEAGTSTANYAQVNGVSGDPVGWKQAVLNDVAMADFGTDLASGRFDMGLASRDTGTQYYILFDGWNQTNPPYIEVDYTSANAPEAPIVVAPTDGATDVAIAGNLECTWGDNSDTYDLWLGPTGSMSLVVDGDPCTDTGMTHAYTGLLYESDYEWEVIVYNTNLDYTSGGIWSFTTEDDPNPPTACTNPTPADGAVMQPVNGTLTWDWGGNNVTYDLWFDGAEVVTGANCSGASGSYAYSGDAGTVYDWYVVSYNASGTSVTGDTWSFTTVNPTSGGSMEDGFIWRNQFDAAGPTYSWITPGAGATVIPNPTDDGNRGPFPIGFDFTFYGAMKTEFYFMGNGFLCFNNLSSTLTNQNIPSATNPNDLIAWFWDDLNANDSAPSANTTTITYENMTVLGQNALVVTMLDYRECDSSHDYEMDAQVVLFENGDILMQYASFDEGWDMNSATVGVENNDGSVAVAYEYNYNMLGDQYAIYWERQIDPNAPTSVANPTPNDGATDQPTSGTISWDWGTNNATYDLWFDGVEVVSGENCGIFDNAYSYSGLGNSTTVEWYIISYNSSGSHVTSPTWSFTTEPLTVDSFPYSVNFDEGTLPNGWAQGGDDTAQWRQHTGATGSSGTGPSADHTTGSGYYMYFEATDYTTGAYADLLTPAFDVTLLTNPALHFWYHMYGAGMGTLNVDVWDGSTWTNVWTLSGDQGDMWNEAYVDLSSYNVRNTLQVRFQAVYGTAFTSDVSIDDVSIENINTLPAPASAPTPADGASEIAHSGNLGWTWGANNDTYDLWFGPAGAATEVVTGANCSGGASYAFDGLDDFTTYEWWVVSYSSGGQSAISPHWTFLTSGSEGQVLVGTDVLTGAPLPMYPYYGYTLSQTIYHQSDLNFSDQQMISSVSYYYNGDQAWIEDPCSIYMAHTTQDSLNDWLADDFQLVWMDSLEVTTTPGWVEIELDTPFIYNNTDNLAVMFHAGESGYHSDAAWFYCSLDPDMSVSAVFYNDSTNPDPMSPPVMGTTTSGWTNAYPNMIFHHEDVMLGSVQGYVYENGGTTPIDGATVTIGGQSATTNGSGFYEFPEVITGTYDMTASHPLFIDETVTGVIVTEGNTTNQNFGLLWSEISVDIASFNVNVDLGNTQAEQMILTNDGPADLDFAISRRWPAATVRGDVPAFVAEILAGEETSPMGQNHRVVTNSRALFDYQFDFDVDPWSGDGNNTGAETDGQHIYTTVWNTNVIAKFDMQGNFIETFTIAGVTDLRDLAYDGRYFYGSDAGNYIWEMDFDTQTLVSTITTTGPCRAIAYDSDRDAFWANDWATDMKLFDRTGAVIDSMTSMPSMYGAAYDNYSADGPYLWFFTGTSTGGGCQIEQYDMTGTATGVSFDPQTAIGGGIAGGLFIAPDMVPGTVTLGGLIQGDANDKLFGFELGSTWIEMDVTSGTVPAGGNQPINVTFGADATPGVYSGEFVITNNANYTVVRGDDYIVPFTLTVSDVALATPANVMIEMSGDDVVLTWDEVPFATAYHVYYATDPNGTWNEITGSPVSAETFTHTGAGASGMKYYYMVTADNPVVR